MIALIIRKKKRFIAFVVNVIYNTHKKHSLCVATAKISIDILHFKCRHPEDEATQTNLGGLDPVLAEKISGNRVA